MKLKLLLFLLSVLTINNIFSQKKIFYAIEKGQIDVVKQYIADGNDLDVTCGYKAEIEDGAKQVFDRTLMECAIYYDQNEILDLLIENKEKFKNYKDQISKAFASSISKGNMKLIKKLLDEGADINTICKSCYNQDALMIALNYKNHDIVNFLMEKGITIDNRQNDFGYTLVMLAVILEDKDILQVFIDKGVDINIPDNDGWTPVMVAASNGNLEIFNLLMDNDAILDRINTDGEDALLIAISGENSDIIKYLIEIADMDASTQDAYGNNPIIVAVKNQNTDIVKYLIEKESYLDQVNEDGDYALTIAIELNNIELAKILIEAGTNLWELDYLKFARKYIKDEEFLKYLEEKIEGGE